MNQLDRSSRLDGRGHFSVLSQLRLIDGNRCLLIMSQTEVDITWKRKTLIFPQQYYQLYFEEAPSSDETIESESENGRELEADSESDWEADLELYSELVTSELDFGSDWETYSDLVKPRPESKNYVQMDDFEEPEWLSQWETVSERVSETDLEPLTERGWGSDSELDLMSHLDRHSESDSSWETDSEIDSDTLLGRGSEITLIRNADIELDRSLEVDLETHFKNYLTAHFNNYLDVYNNTISDIYADLYLETYLKEYLAKCLLTNSDVDLDTYLENNFESDWENYLQTSLALNFPAYLCTNLDSDLEIYCRIYYVVDLLKHLETYYYTDLQFELLSDLMNASDTETVVSDSRTLVQSDFESRISSGSEIFITEDSSSDSLDSVENWMMYSSNSSSSSSDFETNPSFIQSESELEIDASSASSSTDEESNFQYCFLIDIQFEFTQMAGISTYPQVGQRFEIDLATLPNREDLVRLHQFMSSNDPTYSPAVVLHTLTVHYDMSMQARRVEFITDYGLHRITRFYTQNVYPILIFNMICLVLCILYMDIFPAVLMYFGF